ncbi:MAG: hypothetical protein ACK4SY_02955 [Pyrobaculum sp.]
MYRVLINRKLERVLVTGREGDLELLKEGWEIVFQAPLWKTAFNYALEVAEDEIIEWYYEDQMAAL